MRLSLRAAIDKEPAAIEIMKAIEEELKMRVECAREAFGYPRPASSQMATPPIGYTILTAPYPEIPPEGEALLEWLEEHVTAPSAGKG